MTHKYVDMSLESSLMIKNVNFQRPVKKSGPVSSLSKPQKERNALQAIMRYSQAEKLTGLKE